MIRKFFILCSGADTDLLNTCSQGEQSKYAGIGATVFFTALMATLAASYALFTVFERLLPAVVFGLVWGLLIFNLDRYIVATLRKKDNFGKELLQATPRLFLALIIAVVIAKPLELRIFEKEIDQVLLGQKNEMRLENREQVSLRYEPLLQEKENEILALKQEIEAKEASTDALYDTYIAEAEGRAGTLLLGKGPVYAEKREKHDASLAELQSLKESNSKKISIIEGELSKLEADYSNDLAAAEPVIDNFDGIMARINALQELPWFPSFFIFLLFLAIETAPILVKLMSPKGPYDHKLEEQESLVGCWATQKVRERQHIVATDALLNQRIYGEIAEEEAVYAYKKARAEELMQAQANRFRDIQLENL